jgi:hypothetical protein
MIHDAGGIGTFTGAWHGLALKRSASLTMVHYVLYDYDFCMALRGLLEARRLTSTMSVIGPPSGLSKLASALHASSCESLKNQCTLSNRL